MIEFWTEDAIETVDKWIRMLKNNLTAESKNTFVRFANLRGPSLLAGLGLGCTEGKFCSGKRYCTMDILRKG